MKKIMPRREFLFVGQAIVATATVGCSGLGTSNLAQDTLSTDGPLALPPPSTFTFEKASGVQIVDTAAFFTGDKLAYSLQGASFKIDQRTGRVAIPTWTTLDMDFTVVASNDSGIATQDFSAVVVEASQASNNTAPADFVVGGTGNAATNTAQLMNAMVNAAAMSGPRVIRVRSGDYNALNRATALKKIGANKLGINDNARVTVIAEARNAGTGNDRARFLSNTGGELTRIDGFTFDGFVFESTAKDQQGFPEADNKALILHDIANITFRNCTFKGQHRCLVTQGALNFKVEWCEFTRIGMDCISVFQDHNNIIKFHNNHFHNEDVDAARASSDQPNRHPDASSTQGSNNTDVEWLRNLYVGPNSYWQGIFCANSKGVNAGGTRFNHKNVKIHDNTVVSCHVNAIFIGGTEQLSCLRNKVRRLALPNGQSYAGNTSMPSIVLAAYVSGDICDNDMPRALNLTKSPAGPKTMNGNTVRAGVSVPAASAQALHQFPVGPYGYE